MSELELYKGKRKDFLLTFTYGDNSPVDLTGGTINFMVKKKYVDKNENALIAKTITSISDPQNGIVKIEVLPSDSVNIPIGNYFYEIELERGADDIRTILQGVLYIKDVIIKG